MNNRGYQDGFVGRLPIKAEDHLYDLNYRQGVSNRYRKDTMDEAIRFQIERDSQRFRAQELLQTQQDFARSLDRHFEAIDRAFGPRVDSLKPIR